MSFLFQIILYVCCTFSLEAKVSLGVDRIFEPEWVTLLQGKNIGLITNQTGVTSALVPTIDILENNQKKYGYTLSCLFAPEHGLYGEGYAWENIKSGKTASGLPIFSLHGETRRPTKEMLKDVTLLLFDIQDIGSRSYTFANTLFYAMEEAAKSKIPVLVLDRPNPLGGLIVDGPMLEKEFRSFVGYINVPYCHGMTIGELARFFNDEYHIGCNLSILPMKGWQRTMSFEETGLQWIPTSPNIPNSKVTYYYPAVGMLGELGIVAIGIGYTLPFQVVAAPWIDGSHFASILNQYKLPGVYFTRTHIKPFFGRYAKESCQGAYIIITDPKKFQPFTTQCAIFHALRRCYPKTFQQALTDAASKKDLFYKICGTKMILECLQNKNFSLEELSSIHKKERSEFLKIRNAYLLY